MDAHPVIKDIAERAFWTFAEAFLAVFVVGATISDTLMSGKGAAIAGVAAALAVVKGFVASRAGKGTAAFPEPKA